MHSLLNDFHQDIIIHPIMDKHLSDKMIMIHIEDGNAIRKWFLRIFSIPTIIPPSQIGISTTTTVCFYLQINLMEYNKFNQNLSSAKVGEIWNRTPIQDGIPQLLEDIFQTELNEAWHIYEYI